jgi:hypothetical protein
LRGCIRAEVAWARDWADRRVVVGRPVEPRVFVRYWVDGWAGCGRWGACGVVVVLSYPSVLAFQWFAYPVAVCGFVLELPGLV